MAGATEVRAGAKSGSDHRPVRRPAATTRPRVSSLPVSARKKEDVVKNVRRPAARVVPENGVNWSEDGSCSSDSSSGRSLVKGGGLQCRRKHSGVRPVKVVPESVDVPLALVSVPSVPVSGKKRCSWITPNSESIYVSFHDEEWGVPVHDDGKLFELFVLSGSLAELTWPTILNKRDIFRKLFNGFDLSSVAKFSEKEILLLTSGRSGLLSEQKTRAVAENARQMLKVIEEFGSFSNYCWSFVNHKPIISGFRYARQVPIKTPKAETMSKDLLRRGFRCVGPTIIYSFMQAAGITNDHLTSCFRFEDCIGSHLQQAQNKQPVTSSKTLS